VSLIQTTLQLASIYISAIYILNKQNISLAFCYASVHTKHVNRQKRTSYSDCSKTCHASTQLTDGFLAANKTEHNTAAQIILQRQCQTLFIEHNVALTKPLMCYVHCSLCIMQFLINYRNWRCFMLEHILDHQTGNREVYK